MNPPESGEVFTLAIEGTIVGKHMTDFQIVLSTCADHEQAERIAHRLVEQQVAACVNILPGVQSIYRWQGKVDSTGEVLMLIKTRADLVPEVETTIAGLHSYQVPEFLVLPVFGGSHAYLAWLTDSLR
jgi:periplasmic divalent cation tolerance protein